MRAISSILLLLCLPLSFSGVITRAAAQTPLTQVRQVVALTNLQAAQQLPVDIEATVTYVRPSGHNLFVEDAGSAIYVRLGQNFQDVALQSGDRVAITGKTGDSFLPVVVADRVRFLTHGKLPVPQPASFEDLIRSRWDSHYVLVAGRVLSVSPNPADTSGPTLHIQVKMLHGVIEAFVDHPGNLRPEALLDADVSLAGVASGEFDSKMQVWGVWLDVNSAKDVTFLQPPDHDPWSEPISPLDSVVFAYRNSNESKRVRIAGTVTYFEPDTQAVIEQQGKGMLVETHSTLPLHEGDGVEATGFPEISGERMRLENAQLRPVAQALPTRAQSVDWEKASAGAYAYNLISMEGSVVGVVHDSRVDQFMIQVQGHLFSATLRQSSSDASRPVGSALIPSVGSRVRVTGVCFVDEGNHWRDQLWFDVRMRSLADIVVLQQPSWWTVKRMAYVVIFLTLAILIAVLWVWWIDRRMRKLNATSALYEQQRSQILEMINSSQPLPQVLREIQSMVSSRLHGASCWCELRTHAEDSMPAELATDPGVVSQELFAPDGASLGFLLAKPVARTSEIAKGSAALLAGARLAELAIDNRRLYTDLRHRSEYDLLTDIPNRFSMERELDKLLLAASRDGSVFGLIYIDLDRFKQINDRYGHRTGDLYLQQATKRMKFQLRAGDMLARIGGDEFVALVPIRNNPADAQEIATRLERCFDETFAIEGCRIEGSASVGLAVYPEDGTNKEDLQRSADAAMYANKETTRHRETMTMATLGRELAPPRLLDPKSMTRPRQALSSGPVAPQQPPQGK